MDASKRKEAIRAHAMELEDEIRLIHTPGVTTGRDCDVVDFVVIGKEIDGGRLDDHRRLLIHVKGEPGKFRYDLEYRHSLAKVPVDAVVLDRSRTQAIDAVASFLNVQV